MQIDKKYLAIKTALLIVVVVTWGTFLAGCTSAKQKKEYRDAQVHVIGKQVAARTEQGKAEAAARAALYAAMAEVARSAPDSADAIAVALAISSVQEEKDSSGTPFRLYQEQNEAVEIAKAIGPSLVNVLGTVAVAGYQASVSKNNSDNAALVAIGESGKDADIMRSVTTMGSIGLQRETISVGGDYSEAGGNIDQSLSTTTSATTNDTNSTSTTTTTTTDSYNQTTYATPDGSTVTIDEIETLIAEGIQVTVIIDGEEVPVDSCDDVLTFGGSC